MGGAGLDPSDGDHRGMDRVDRPADQLLQTLHDRQPETERTPPATPAQLDDCGWVANRWCELLPVPLPLKQQLMALDNPLVRLELVGDVLDRTGIAP